mgnify:CR=1 FL=1
MNQFCRSAVESNELRKTKDPSGRRTDGSKKISASRLRPELEKYTILIGGLLIAAIKIPYDVASFD